MQMNFKYDTRCLKGHKQGQILHLLFTVLFEIINMNLCDVSMTGAVLARGIKSSKGTCLSLFVFNH